jgi:hypothetical protein
MFLKTKNPGIKVIIADPPVCIAFLNWLNKIKNVQILTVRHYNNGF